MEMLAASGDYVKGKIDFDAFQKEMEKNTVELILAPGLMTAMEDTKKAAKESISNLGKDTKKAISTVMKNLDTSMKGNFASSVQKESKEIAKNYDSL